MVDPTGLLAPNTRREQEQVILYIIAVAGKRSENAIASLGRFLFFIEGREQLPFTAINTMTNYELMEALKFARLSPYKMKHKAFRHVSKFWRLDRDLKSITPNEWANVGGERVGIGPKTSRYICMCLDPENTRYAALDTHILKWLRHIGYKDAPKSTPPAGIKYNHFEQLFLAECDRRGRNPAEFDLQIWEAYKYGQEIPA